MSGLTGSSHAAVSVNAALCGTRITLVETFLRLAFAPPSLSLRLAFYTSEVTLRFAWRKDFLPLRYFQGRLLNLSPYVSSVAQLNVLDIAFRAFSTASLCFLTYSLPGSVDYPSSVATSLQFSYITAPPPSLQPGPVLLLNGTGRRTYTDRFGVSTTTSLTLAPAGTQSSNNLLYLSATPSLDSSGLALQLSSAVQLAGGGYSAVSSVIRLYRSSSGLVVESEHVAVDVLGSAFYSSVPSFVNVSLAPSNGNALAADYLQCRAPITFFNGLLGPTEPGPSNGALQFSYSYSLSDGLLYSVRCELTLRCVSAFASVQDALGNAYQTVVSITGTRLYTHLPSNATHTSTVSLSSSATTTTLPDSRFYPYALLTSSPGVYNMDTAPYLDATGLQLDLHPAVPSNGLPPGTGLQYNTTAVYFYTPSPITSTVLTETHFVQPPMLALQRQTYTLL